MGKVEKWEIPWDVGWKNWEKWMGKQNICEKVRETSLFAVANVENDRMFFSLESSNGF